MTKALSHLSGFSRAMLALTALLLALLLVGLGLLWAALSDYQGALPATLAHRVCAAFKEADGAALSGWIPTLPPALEDPETFSAFLRENYAPLNVRSYTDGASTAERPLYVIAGGERPLARLALRRVSQPSRFGFDRYEVQSLTLSPLWRYRITAPAGAAVTLDGAPLDAGHISARETLPCFSELGLACERVTYTLDEFAFVREIAATAPDGSACAVDWDRASQRVEIHWRPDAARQQALSAFAEDFAKDYAYFATAHYAPRSGLLGRMVEGSDFYERVLRYNNDWGEVYARDRYDDLRIDNYCQYSATEFSCDLRMTYVAIQSGGASRQYPMAFRCCMTAVGGEYKMADLEIL